MFQRKTATDGERFFVGGWDNTFRAIDAAGGKVVWEKKVGRDAKSGKIMFYYSPAISSPAVGGGKVFVTTNDGVLHAFDAATGEVKWEYDWKKLGYSSPLYHDGRVYCAIGDEGNVFCVDARDGRRIWQAQTKDVIYDSSCVLAGGKVFVGSVNGTFNAIDAADGQIVWQYRLGPGHVLASPAADGGTRLHRVAIRQGDGAAGEVIPRRGYRASYAASLCLYTLGSGTPSRRISRGSTLR